jgi:murein L,D-transpeptidase YafK
MPSVSVQLAMRPWLILFCFIGAASWAEDRISKIKSARLSDLKALVEAQGLSYPVDEVYLRVFKTEKNLELWAGDEGQPFKLIKSYPICAASGELGPKRKEGDLQVPEGLYEISEFNPGSNFHLSMKLSYPNASDKKRSDAKRPGGLIYLHGNCVSIGCIAIEDGPIEEVYFIARDSKLRPLRIDVFPFRMTEEAMKKAERSEHAKFWAELKPAFVRFEESKRPVQFRVLGSGVYLVP